MINMAKLAKKVSSLIKIKTIKNRFLVVMILLTIIPISIIGIISYRIARDTIEKNHISSHEASLRISSEVLDLKLQDVININRNILSSKQLVGELNEYLKINDTTPYFNLKSVQVFDQILGRFNLNSNYIDSICIVDKSGRLYFYGVYSGMSKYFKDTSYVTYRNSDWFKKTEALKGKEQFFGYNVFAPNNKESFSCTKLLRDPDNFNEIGTLIINIRTIMFEKTFINLKKFKNEGTYLIFDEVNNNMNSIFSNNQDNKIQSMIDDKEFLSLNDFKNNGYIVSNVINETTKWEIAHIIEKEKLFRDTKLIRLTTIIVSVLMILIILIMFIILSNAVNKPLKMLEKVIDDVGKGNRNIIEEFGDDEIGTIGNQFKNMVNENLKLSEKIMASDLKEKEAELKLLQAQINPHFLYNTLDSIYWLAVIKKADDIAKMTIALSEIFKLSLNKGNDITTIKDEIKHIEHYLTIQNFRYKGRFNVSIEIEEGLIEGKILKLLLQPFVENAIYHGLEPKVGEGYIHVSGKIEDELAVFIIKDDGVGMDSEARARMGYGIKNVQERIKLYYGEKYTVDFKSEINKGTKVVIKLPLEKII